MRERGEEGMGGEFPDVEVLSGGAGVDGGGGSGGSGRGSPVGVLMGAGGGRKTPASRCGATSDVGRRTLQEDEHCVVQGELQRRIEASREARPSSPSSSPGAAAAPRVVARVGAPTRDTLCGVFDGHCTHGGKLLTAAGVARERLSELLLGCEEVLRWLQGNEGGWRDTGEEEEEVGEGLDGYKCRTHAALAGVGRGVEEEVARCFREVDEAIRDLVQEGVAEESGTTALLALVLGSALLVAHVGDSRAVLSRGGKAVDLTCDHRPTEEAEEKRIRAHGGWIEMEAVNGILSVSRALGDWDLFGPEDKEGVLVSRPDVSGMCIDESQDEFLLLACDGLWDVMTSQSAIQFVRAQLLRHNDPERAAAALVQAAVAHVQDGGMGSTDNVTCIVVCLQTEGPATPESRYPGSRLPGRTNSRIFKSVADS